MPSLLERVGRLVKGVLLAGGKVTGDIRVNGFPKNQATFARVMGYALLCTPPPQTPTPPSFAGLLKDKSLIVGLLATH